MIRQIKDILKEAGLIKPDGYMTYIIDDGGVRKSCKMYVEADWGIEEYDNSDTTPLYKGKRIVICKCLTPYEMRREGALEEEKKRVYLSVLQGILSNNTHPKENRVHLWSEEMDGFTYVYGAIRV